MCDVRSERFELEYGVKTTTTGKCIYKISLHISVARRLYTCQGCAFIFLNSVYSQISIPVLWPQMLADITPDQENAKKPARQDKPPARQRDLRSG